MQLVTSSFPLGSLRTANGTISKLSFFKAKKNDDVLKKGIETQDHTI